MEHLLLQKHKLNYRIVSWLFKALTIISRKHEWVSVRDWKREVKVGMKNKRATSKRRQMSRRVESVTKLANTPGQLSNVEYKSSEKKYVKSIMWYPLLEVKLITIRTMPEQIIYRQTRFQHAIPTYLLTGKNFATRPRMVQLIIQIYKLWRLY